MKKLLKEFKDFISKGSVIDLAVGMIIGSAFTAIVTALVNGILKPLINWIPISESGLQTVLRPAVIAENGSVITEALILDWGAVISAIITFLITALVLFLIIKAINKVKKAGETAAEKIKEAKEKHDTNVTAGAVAEEAAATVTEETEVAAAPVEIVKVTETKPTSEELLAEIVALLKEQNK